MPRRSHSILAFKSATARTPGLVVRRLGAALCVLIVAGCASQPAAMLADRSVAWQLRSAQLAGITHWALKGRIAVQVERDGWSATLLWEQRPEDYVLRLSAPLGRGTFVLSGSPAGVTLQTADNRVLHANEPETLMQEALGWQLPVSGLQYWVRGVPDPGTGFESLELDEAGRLNNLVQDGWHISYERYGMTGDVELPGKITLENDRLKVRLVIGDWILSS